MKKLSFIGMALIAGSTLSAQTAAQFEAQALPSKTNEIVNATRSNRSIDRSAAFFYEDFANGLDGNNGFGAWTAEGPDADLWMYDTDGPNGAFSNPVTQIIQSPTVDNGFMIFDADFSHGDGSEGYITRQGALVSPLLNFVGQTSAVVTLSTAYRYCCSQTHQINLEVSIDGGGTYLAENTIQINSGGEVNSNYNGEYSFNITQIVSNQPLIKLRFSWGAGSTHYFWQLDDISIDPAPAIDMSMVSFEMIHDDTVSLGLQQNYSLGQEPSDVAISRLFMAIVKNNTDNPSRAYLMLDLSINEDIISVGDSLNNVIVPANGGIDTIFINYTPSVWIEGDYAVTATVNTLGANLSSDASPENNIRPSQFSITDEIVSAIPHNYIATTVHDNLFDFDETDDIGEEPQEVEYYNRWIQFEPITFVAMATAFSDITDVGAKFTFGIYPTVTNQLDKQNPYFFGANYKTEGGVNVNQGVEADMIGTERVILPFMSPDFNDDTFEEFLYADSVTLPGDPLGAMYAASITLPDDAAAGIIGARNGNGQGNRQMSLQYGPFDDGDYATYLSSGMNMIELYRAIDASTAISEIQNRPDFYLAQNRPNPFQGGTTITYQLNKKASAVSFNVFDVTGKQVMNIEEGSRGAGQYNIELDATEFTTGLYYYSLTVNGQKLTRKMVITE
jgi:hypothetical protein